MKIIEGAYASAKVFTVNNDMYALEPYAEAQLKMLCDNEASKGCKIRVMPDVHPGKVGTIGLTMTVGERILPNLVGIDIGCGVTVAKLKQKKIEYQKLDTVIREHIPAGFAVRKKPHRFAAEFDSSALYCASSIRKEKAALSLGTLGGGNHFIELDNDGEGNLYAVIHSGSRHLGKEVTEYYLNEGQKQLKANGLDVPYELTWLEGDLKEQYLHDLQLVQDFAVLNREAILDELVSGMKWKVEESFRCIHNYVDDSGELPILRKGAISARANEPVIIPINMRDGLILGIGKGNVEWNYSAPHGAGRILRRDEVKNQYTVLQYKAEMKGIHSVSVSAATLDEAPFAYRKLNEIAEVIDDTVEIQSLIRPVYNFKAGGEA